MGGEVWANFILGVIKGGPTLHPRIFAEAVFMQNYSKTTCCRSNNRTQQPLVLALCFCLHKVTERFLLYLFYFSIYEEIWTCNVS